MGQQASHSLSLRLGQQHASCSRLSSLVGSTKHMVLSYTFSVRSSPPLGKISSFICSALLFRLDSVGVGDRSVFHWSNQSSYSMWKLGSQEGQICQLSVCILLLTNFKSHWFSFKIFSYLSFALHTH